MTRSRLIGGLIITFLCLLTGGNHAAASAYIHGTVFSDPSGHLLSGIRIRVFDAAWNYISAASTDTLADGTFVTGELPDGIYYLRAVAFYPDPYVPEYWYDSIERETAIPIRIEYGTDVYGIDFRLARGGYLRGRIVNQAGEPLSDLDLDVYDNEWTRLKSITCMTEDDGSYLLGPLPEGHFFIRTDPDLSHGVQPRYWPGAYYREEATYIAIHPDTEIPGIDFVLPPGAVISGHVFQSLGGVVRDCSIRVYNLDWIAQPIHQSISNDQGEYQAFGLPAGDYYLEADPEHGCGFRGNFYPDTTQENARPVHAEPLTITENIDFILPEGNFDVQLALDMPGRHFDPGDMFYLNLIIEHDGPELNQLPVFLILEGFGSYFFWPEWTRFNPPEQVSIDYDLRDIPSDETIIEVFSPFAWPHTGIDADGLRFIGAVTNWSISDVIGDPDVVSWSFDP